MILEGLYTGSSLGLTIRVDCSMEIQQQRGLVVFSGVSTQTGTTTTINIMLVTMSIICSYAHGCFKNTQDIGSRRYCCEHVGFDKKSLSPTKKPRRAATTTTTTTANLH